MGGNGSLFESLRRLPDSKLHPLFLIIRDSRSHIPARGLMDQVFSEYVDKDGNFVRDFQTQGFSARIWELSVFAYVFEEGYTLDSTHAMPDVIIPEGCAIEAVTNQPRDPMSPSHVNLDDEEGYRAFVTINRSAGITEFQNQLRKAITSKMGKRFKDGLAYWELPHIRDLPFVLAVQCFYGGTRPPSLARWLPSICSVSNQAWLAYLTIPSWLRSAPSCFPTAVPSRSSIASASSPAMASMTSGYSALASTMTRRLVSLKPASSTMKSERRALHERISPSRCI